MSRIIDGWTMIKSGSDLPPKNRPILVADKWKRVGMAIWDEFEKVWMEYTLNSDECEQSYWNAGGSIIAWRELPEHPTIDKDKT